MCIPTYRGATFLGRTIESVLAQSLADFELHVIDDNSPDDSAAIVARYADPRIHYRRNAVNLGPAGAWGECLSAARGKYFKLLPHDDLLEPDCLAEQVAVLEEDRDESIALVFGSRRVIDAQDRTLMRRKPPFPVRTPLPGREVIRRCVRAAANLIGEPGNALVRRKTALAVGGYDTTYPYVVDLDFWCRILHFGNAYCTGTPASAFRVSGQSWSVAIGRGQHRDLDGLARRLAADRTLGIGWVDLRVGQLNARLNTLGRGAIYRALRFGDRDGG